MSLNIPLDRKHESASRNKSSNDIQRNSTSSFANSSSQTIVAFPPSSSTLTPTSSPSASVTGSSITTAASASTPTTQNPASGTAQTHGLDQTSSGGLAPGAIGAIVAVLLILLGGILAMLYLRRRRRQERTIDKMDEKQIGYPVHPETRASSPAAGEAYSSNDVRIVHIVYQPSRQDEMVVALGDKIEVIEIFDDGWCSGYNFMTKKFGVLPIECLNEPEARA